MYHFGESQVYVDTVGYVAMAKGFPINGIKIGRYQQSLILKESVISGVMIRQMEEECILAGERELTKEKSSAGKGWWLQGNG